MSNTILVYIIGKNRQINRARITLVICDETIGQRISSRFELLDRERAKKIFDEGRDERGNFYSLATWMVLSIFLSL